MVVVSADKFVQPKFIEWLVMMARREGQPHVVLLIIMNDREITRAVRNANLERQSSGLLTKADIVNVFGDFVAVRRFGTPARRFGTPASFSY